MAMTTSTNRTAATTLRDALMAYLYPPMHEEPKPEALKQLLGHLASTNSLKVIEDEMRIKLASSIIISNYSDNRLGKGSPQAPKTAGELWSALQNDVHDASRGIMVYASQVTPIIALQLLVSLEDSFDTESLLSTFADRGRSRCYWRTEYAPVSNADCMSESCFTFVFSIKYYYISCKPMVAFSGQQSAVFHASRPELQVRRGSSLTAVRYQPRRLGTPSSATTTDRSAMFRVLILSGSDDSLRLDWSGQTDGVEAYLSAIVVQLTSVRRKLREFASDVLSVAIPSVSGKL